MSRIRIFGLVGGALLAGGVFLWLASRSEAPSSHTASGKLPGSPEIRMGGPSVSSSLARPEAVRPAKVKPQEELDAALAVAEREWEAAKQSAMVRDPALEPLFEDYGNCLLRTPQISDASWLPKLLPWMDNEKYEGHTRRSGQARALRQFEFARQAAALLEGGSAKAYEFSRTDVGPLLREIVSGPGFYDQPASEEELADWERPMTSASIPRQVLEALTKAPEKTLESLRAAVGGAVDELAYPLLEEYQETSTTPALCLFVIHTALQSRLTPEELAAKAHYESAMLQRHGKPDQINR